MQAFISFIAMTLLAIIIFLDPGNILVYSTTVNFAVHDSTLLKCNSTDSPVWFFNMQILPPNACPLVLLRKFLRIANIGLSNAGIYQCYGNNDEGRFITQWTLKVYGMLPLDTNIFNVGICIFKYCRQ